MPNKTSDVLQCKLSLDAVMLEAIDANRGDQTRAQFILSRLARSLKLKGYQPRGRGQPRKEKP